MQPEEAKQLPGKLRTSMGFRWFGSRPSPVHLPPASWCLCLPIATCAQRSPILHPALLRDPFTERQRSGPSSLCASVLLPPREENEGRPPGEEQHSPEGLSPSVLTPSRGETRHHPGRQAPLNAGASARAIAVSPHGDMLPRPGRDERAPQQPRASWVLLGRQQTGGSSGGRGTSRNPGTPK